MRAALKVFLAVVMLAVAAGVAALLMMTRKETQARPAERVPASVRVLTLSPTNLVLRVRSRGAVAPRTATRLGSLVSGEIVEVAPNFERGGRVRAGQLLLRIDPTDYEAALAGAEARVATAALQLAEAEADAANVERDLSQLGLDPAEASDLVLRKPQLAVAEAGLKAARTDLDMARRNLERTEIRAPFDGILGAILVNRGQVVTAIGTPLAELEATDVYEISAPVSPEELVQLGFDETGTNAAPLRAEIAGGAWTGVVRRTAGRVDARDRMPRVIVSVPDPLGGEAPLRAGQFVDVDLLGPSLEDALLLPRDAVQPDGGVIVVGLDNTAGRRSVTLGWGDRERVLVHDGLSAGERVCRTRVSPFVEGMRVEPRP